MTRLRLKESLPMVPSMERLALQEVCHFQDFVRISLTIIPGWTQCGGHGPMTSAYGLGSDNVLEFQVVTADGQLKIANSVANPDLFWALRGGCGGTFGIG
jgi:FAD/FMN-containing dehydrogenase